MPVSMCLPPVADTFYQYLYGACFQISLGFNSVVCNLWLLDIIVDYTAFDVMNVQVHTHVNMCIFTFWEVMCEIGTVILV